MKSVVWLVLDCLRFDYAERHFTELLGRLFPRWYSVAHCSDPNMCAMFTGRHPVETGVYCQERLDRDVEFETYAEHVSRLGYRTFSVTLPTSPAFYRRGFDSVLHNRAGGCTTPELLTRIQQELFSDPGTRFYGYIRLMDAHGGPYAEGSYAKAVRKLRGHVAAILQWLSRLDAAWIITADHGEGLGQHGNRTHNWGIHEEIVHVPLYTSVDVPRAGLWQHTSMWPLSESLRDGSSGLPRSCELAQFAGIGGKKFWRKGKDVGYDGVIAFRGLRSDTGTKVIETNTGSSVDLEVYNLKKDPSEERNLAPERDWSEWRAKLCPMPPLPGKGQEEDDLADRLRGLGYMD